METFPHLYSIELDRTVSLLKFALKLKLVYLLESTSIWDIKTAPMYKTANAEPTENKNSQFFLGSI